MRLDARELRLRLVSPDCISRRRCAVPVTGEWGNHSSSWKRVGCILSVMGPETFFTAEDAENAQAISEGADPEDFEDEAARRGAQVIADFKPWQGEGA